MMRMNGVEGNSLINRKYFIMDCLFERTLARRFSHTGRLRRTSPEGRLIIEGVLLATEAGLGNGETPIFPIHIFKIKEGIN